jgi:6-phosphogluconolactonase
MPDSGRPQPRSLAVPWRILCRDETHAAAEAARFVLDAFVSRRQPEFGLALSGGRVASRFFGALVAESSRRGVPFGNSHFFWADERCVPPNHAESNFRLARAQLLEPLAVAPSHIHRLAGELPPSEAVALATDDWQRWERRRARGHTLDCVVLGVGEDGHVASLFPDNLGTDLAALAPVRHVTGPKPPPDRLTLGYPVLWHAARVLVLAPGPAKRPIIDASLAGTLDTPLARVIRGRGSRPTTLILSN